MKTYGRGHALQVGIEIREKDLVLILHTAPNSYLSEFVIAKSTAVKGMGFKENTTTEELANRSNSFELDMLINPLTDHPRRDYLYEFPGIASYYNVVSIEKYF